MQDETWYHDNFFRYATYLHARVPQIHCRCCGPFCRAAVVKTWVEVHTGLLMHAGLGRMILTCRCRTLYLNSVRC